MDLIAAIKQIIPPPAIKLGRRLYRATFKRFILKSYYRRLSFLVKETAEIKKYFSEEELCRHYVYEPMRQTLEHPDQFINQIRYYRMYKFFLENYPQIFNNKTSVADVGDTSGILFRAMGRNGLSVNINPQTVDFIKNRGINAEIGDIEELPFKNRSFEYVFCFECIEHVSNPVRALQELGRIAQKKIFLSIPYVEKTVIYDAIYWKALKSQEIKRGGWSELAVRDTDCHKFEFSTADFKKILTLAPLKYCDNFPINYFEPLGATRKNRGSYFNFFILEPF